MKCYKCGHPTPEHGAKGCNCIVETPEGGWDFCNCPVPAEVLLEAELTLARELIAVLSHDGTMPENMMVDKGEAWRKWQAEDLQP